MSYNRIYAALLCIVLLPIFCLSIRANDGLLGDELIDLYTLLDEDGYGSEHAGSDVKKVDDILKDEAQDSNRELSLCDAIRNRNKLKCVELMEDPRTMTMVESDGSTPLHVAVREYDVMMIRMLILAGADAYAEDKVQCTPYALARLQGPAQEQFLLDWIDVYESNKAEQLPPVNNRMAWKKAAALCACTGLAVLMMQIYLDKKVSYQKGSSKLLTR